MIRLYKYIRLNFIIPFVLLFFILSIVIYIAISITRPLSYESEREMITEPTQVRGPKMLYQEMPDEVRAVYLTACYASNKKLRDIVVSHIENTRLNSIIIDIKDYTGTISFKTENPLLEIGQGGEGCKVADMKEFVAELHKKGIYVIGRITVFQDPLYARKKPHLAVQSKSARLSGSEQDTAVPWKDGKGLSFIDVGAKEYWDYIVALAKESHKNIGFDEINFDYIRYPSDGNMSDTYYPHSGGERDEVNMPLELEKFFVYLHGKMSEPNSYGEVPYTSADLFGMTTTNYDDLTIGQVLERAFPYFDVIAPMVYPSHYPKGFLGFANVNDHPYEIVNYSMKKAVERAQATSTKIASFAYTKIEPEKVFDGEGNDITPKSEPIYKKPAYTGAKLRTWIQDFDYGGDYDVPEINAQIKASRDAGVTGGYMIWSPSNRYTKGVAY